MRTWLAALGLVVATAAPALGGVISFDTTPGGAGGTLTYDGAGGPAVGAGIVFVDVEGINTPLNAGVAFPCVSCTLAFSTGANQVEGPSNWTFAGGGTFVLTGSVPAAGIGAGSTLLSGVFTELGDTPGLVGSTPNGLFLGVGTDEKHPLLTAFFGEANGFTFANTEIALGSFTGDPVTGAFSAVPNQADIVNLAAAVPQPAALLLLGLGLVGASGLMRPKG